MVASVVGRARYSFACMCIHRDAKYVRRVSASSGKLGAKTSLRNANAKSNRIQPTGEIVREKKVQREKTR